MNFLDICKKRCSVRSYKPELISDSALNQLLEAARLAPSAVNFQPWIIIIVKEENNRRQLHECYPREWFKSAPLYLVVCADHEQSWKRKSDEKDHADIDIAIAVEHICLAATELGIGTCWVCNFDPNMLHQQLELPSHITPVAILPIGYPNTDVHCDSENKHRKPLNEIVRWEKY